MVSKVKRSRSLNREKRSIVKLIRHIIAKEKASNILNSESNEARELIENIRNAKREWINANQRFEYAGEQGIVDYHTYNIKACQVRYEYYIKIAKQKGIRLDQIDEAEVRIN